MCSTRHAARRTESGPLLDVCACSAMIAVVTYRLTDASVDFRAGGVGLSYTVVGRWPSQGALVFSTTFTSPGGERVEQLGFELVDDRVVGAWSRDSFPAAEYAMRSYSVNPRRTGDVWTIGFPADALGAARGGTWRADLEVDGNPSGSVAGRPGSTLTEEP
jgi:hypothetical protein